jgi:hypothetical protein
MAKAIAMVLMIYNFLQQVPHSSLVKKTHSSLARNICGQVRVLRAARPSSGMHLQGYTSVRPVWPLRLGPAGQPWLQVLSVFVKYVKRSPVIGLHG